MQLRFHRYDLPLRHVFTIAHGSSSVYRALVVELREGEHSGYGEAGESDYYGVTRDAMIAALEQVRPQIEAYRFGDPAELWDRLSAPLAEHPFAQAALDAAAHDLWGKLRGQPVWKLWGLKLEDRPASNYTIGIDSIDTMVAKLREYPDWPIYKIKLGTPDDVGIVRELRRHTRAVFRVDANCSWSAEQTIAQSGPLAELGVEFIEQPLAPDRWADMAEVVRRSAVPIIADESCQRPPDVDRCQGHFHGVNIKLVKCGGLTPARRMIARARELGLKTMVGCMTESTVGISAIGQLLPLLDYVDMDGAVLLAGDCATGVRVDRGRAVFPDENGCGVRLTGRS